VSVVELAENAGIPGGRNVGAERAAAALVAFLDDDARFLDSGVLARCAEALRSRPALGAVALRIVDEDGRTARRHVPRVGARDPGHSGSVTAFLGGAVVVRAAAFHAVDGYPAPFVYSMEETDLALRLIDNGWEIHYDGIPAVFHPATDPGRHPAATERTMRNRVWLAHRTLPAPVAALYVVNWLALSALRRPTQTRSLLRAVVGGWRSRPGPRAPIRWRTVARLTRLRRPPII
jgi:GT2 family glycosyltransferase